MLVVALGPFSSILIFAVHVAMLDAFGGAFCAGRPCMFLHLLVCLAGIMGTCCDWLVVHVIIC